MPSGIGTGYCCSKCQAAYVPLKNDIVVVETMGDEEDKPYKLWCADILECPKCNHILISGFGQMHFSEHYEPDFGDLMKKAFLAGILFTVSGKRHAMNHWNGETN